MRVSRPCPICSTPRQAPFLTLGAAPVHQNLLMTSRTEAQACEKGRLDIAFCPGCGFIANVSFDPGLLKYSAEYENAQSWSPRFRSYLSEVASHLITRHDLRGKRVIEIGCGNGDFLKLICELGSNDGIGFDPSFDPERVSLPLSITVFPETYSERHGQYRGDLVCFRHTLEHMGDPVEFVRQVRQAIGPGQDTPIFCEVPDVTWILGHVAFWDFFYEHCNYFSPGSLSRLFAANGFRPLRTEQAFGGQYLWLEAVPAGPDAAAPAASGRAAVDQLAGLADHFASGYRSRMEALRGQVWASARLGRRTVVWGAGAKGVTLLNTLGLGPDIVEFVADVNPRKQGRFVPGTGQEIVSPAFLVDYKPDTVLVMNGNYLTEIAEQLKELRLSPRLLAL